MKTQKDYEEMILSLEKKINDNKEKVSSYQYGIEILQKDILEKQDELIVLLRDYTGLIKSNFEN